MQHIGISLINEMYDIIESAEINFATVANIFWDIKECEQRYPFLAGIDPYGNTYFNVHQAPKVIEELENLKQEKSAEPALKEIIATIEFLKKVEQHTFANFIGD